MSRDDPELALELLPLQIVPFPRGARLWVTLQPDGARLEVLESRRTPVGDLMDLLRPVELRLRRGRGRHLKLLGAESPMPLAAGGPVALAFRAWLGELAALGLAPDDPHPELGPLLRDYGALEEPIPRAAWGEAATALLRIYGVWAPPERCPVTGAPPDGRPAGDFGTAAARPLPARAVVLTQSGPWTLPLARFLAHVEAIYAEAFGRTPAGGHAVRDLGSRGIL